MKRTKLCDRQLPVYSQGEELANMLTHALGAALGIAVLVLTVLRAALGSNVPGIVGCSIYGAAFILMFTISSVYHGLPAGMGKKVMQVIDHCTIYFLIAGTYTPVVLCGILPRYPALAVGLLIFQWTLAVCACTLTAIDLKRYNVFSMICYLGMGWSILPFWRQTLEGVGSAGFLLLLLGGIAYSLGSILYGLGHSRKWMHSAFHVFVVLGAALQALAVLFYTL